MSPTSYRTAPPRDSGTAINGAEKKVKLLFVKKPLKSYLGNTIVAACFVRLVRCLVRAGKMFSSVQFNSDIFYLFAKLYFYIISIILQFFCIPVSKFSPTLLALFTHQNSKYYLIKQRNLIFYRASGKEAAWLKEN